MQVAVIWNYEEEKNFEHSLKSPRPGLEYLGAVPSSDLATFCVTLNRPLPSVSFSFLVYKIDIFLE